MLLIMSIPKDRSEIYTPIIQLRICYLRESGIISCFYYLAYKNKSFIFKNY